MRAVSRDPVTARRARHPGVTARVGVPREPTIPTLPPTFFKNLTVGSGPAPARAYIDELLPDILDGRIQPGRVFNDVVPLDDAPDGYRAMNGRESIKVLIEL